MKMLLVYGMLALGLLSQPALAAPFEDGIAAYSAGDYPKAIAIMRELAAKGDVAAQYNLGLAYANGKGVERDDKEAAIWFRTAADADYAQAELLLGIMYVHGRGVPVDRIESSRWFAKAAEHGNANAQFSLGVAYMDGLGVEKDEARATALFLRSAKQGDGNAQVALGASHAEGKGVPQDQVQAYAWLTVAAEAMEKGRARDLSFGLRDLISKGMSDADKEKASAQAKAFVAAPDPDARPEGVLAAEKPAGEKTAPAEASAPAGEIKP